MGCFSFILSPVKVYFDQLRSKKRGGKYEKSMHFSRVPTQEWNPIIAMIVVLLQITARRLRNILLIKVTQKLNNDAFVSNSFPDGLKLLKNENICID